jgi:phosphoribosyl 1,2-cyclic phosphate phosphodiesterase
MSSFLFLGTGGSVGIPVIGCHCVTCSSNAPQNKRLRPSGLIKTGGKVFLIDAGPDLRQQALRYKIDHLDGVLLTHTHYDHVAGIDDLRAYSFQNKGRLMPFLLSRHTLQTLRERYSYLFDPPQFRCQILEEGTCEFEGIKLFCFHYHQESILVTGFRFGGFAYVSDIRSYDEGVFTALQGVKKLVVSASRQEATRAHFSLAEAVAFANRVGAERTWVTHISHFLDHKEAEDLLPTHVSVAVDGLTLEF